MTNDIFSIKYSAINPGTDKTDILFYTDKNQEKDSASIFSNVFFKEQNTIPRIFVTDTNVAKLPLMQSFLEQFCISEKGNFSNGQVFTNGNNTLLILGPGEPYKTIENVLLIVKTALDKDLQRSSLFIGIGGGVICDMTAFAASIFKRGAQLELVPTTLLAMVDASVGGKTGCDFDSYKNMIGTFYPARKLHIFSEFVQLLPESEYRSGLAETLKTGLLYAPKLFDIIENNKDSVIKREPDIINQMIRRCVIAKASIVEKDLTEKGLRMQLNFGHTFGHALESRAGLGVIPHGDAVAWGIGRALELSLKLKLCEKDYKNQVFAVLKNYGWETNPVHPIMKKNNLTDSIIAQDLIEAMRKDKKNSSEKIRFILQRDINSTVIQEVNTEDVFDILTN